MQQPSLITSMCRSLAAAASRQQQVAAAVTHTAAASAAAACQQQQAELPAACGRYDQRTRRGKLFAGTNGLSRPKPSPRPSRELRAGFIAVPQPGWQAPEAMQPYSISQPTLKQQQQQLLQQQQEVLPMQQLSRTSCGAMAPVLKC